MITREYPADWKPGDEPYYPINDERNSALYAQYEQLAKQTAKVEPNPHYSHLGDVNCTDCHKGHKKSELMCNSCHQFDLKVPH